MIKKMWIKQINLLFPDSSVGKESTCNGWRPQFDSWVRKICWRRDRLPTPVFLAFLCGSAGKEYACNAGALGSIPGLGNPLEKGKATHSSILAQRISWTVWSMRLQRVGNDWATLTFLHLYITTEKNHRFDYMDIC